MKKNPLRYTLAPIYNNNIIRDEDIKHTARTLTQRSSLYIVHMHMCSVYKMQKGHSRENRGCFEGSNEEKFGTITVRNFVGNRHEHIGLRLST